MPQSIAPDSESAGLSITTGWARWEVFALLILLFAFGFLATYQIHRPGLYYDEMFVISPAFGVGAYKTWFGLPILISSYCGAEKSWIYPPIFALFGISAWSIRLPAVLISCGTLAVGYSLLRRILTPLWAVVFSAACAVHPAFIFLTKVDWGPVVIMLFLKALCLLLCFRWLDGQTRRCWSVLGLCAIGFWDKFNFIWFIIALVIATCVIYGDVIFSKLRRLSPVTLLALGIGLIAGGLLALWIIFPLLQRPHTSVFPRRLMDIWALYRYTCTGLGTALMWFKSIPPLPTWTGGVIPVTVMFLLLTLVGRASGRNVDIDWRVLRFCLWCLLMFGVIFLEIVLTPQAGGAHHTIMLFPFDLLACFSAAYLFAKTVPGTRRRLMLVLEGSLLCLWVISNLASLAMHFREFRRTDGFYGRFSPRIEALAKYLDKKGGTADAIYCVEWGLGNQLRALCKPAIARKVRDSWPAFQDWSRSKADAQGTMAELFPPREKDLYLSFTKQDPVYLPAQMHFAEMSSLSTKVTRPVGGFPAQLASTYQLFQSYPR